MHGEFFLIATHLKVVLLHALAQLHLQKQRDGTCGIELVTSSPPLTKSIT
jgi:hypothetical protein